MKKIHIFIISIIILFIIVSVGFVYYTTQFSSYEKNNNKKSIVKSNKYYENLWDETFLNYQKSNSELPKYGVYDFTFSLSAKGDSKNLKSIYNFDKKFSNISIKLFGDYDFSNTEKLSLNGDIRVYFNKPTKKEGDIDVSFNLESGEKINYKINNLNKNLLKVLNLDKSLVSLIYNFYNKNKGKNLTLDVSNNFLGKILQSIKKESKNSPLYKNSKKEEKKIINSFLKNDVIDILSGKTYSDTKNRISFEFNSNNFVEFMEDVSKIIGQEKSFEKDKSLFKNLTLEGFFDIEDKLIVNSKLNTEFLLKGVNKNTGKKDYKVLLSETRFKLPSTDVVDFDIASRIYTNKNPNNKLKLRFKGKIK